MIGTDVTVEPASADDLGGIDAIYDHYVRTSAATFDVEPHSMGWRREWFAAFGDTGPYRLLVARDGGAVVGYAGTLRYRTKPAYSTSVEMTIYVSPDHTGRGIGRALYAALLPLLDREDVHRAYAGIVVPNPASVRLHEAFGFRHVGTFTEQGRKLGRYWDVAWYERPVPAA
jgi:phosphinothricin acetyltransferase